MDSKEASPTEEVDAGETDAAPVSIDLSNAENAAALAEVEVGDCVYLRIKSRSDTELTGEVENVEPDEDEDGADNEDRGYRDKNAKAGRDEMPHGVMIVLGKRR